jgi:hypothetical protein
LKPKGLVGVAIRDWLCPSLLQQTALKEQNCSAGVKDHPSNRNSKGLSPNEKNQSGKKAHTEKDGWRNPENGERNIRFTPTAVGRKWNTELLFQKHFNTCLLHHEFKLLSFRPRRVNVKGNSLTKENHEESEERGNN